MTHTVGRSSPLGIDWPEHEEATVGQSSPLGIDWSRARRSDGWRSSPRAIDWSRTAGNLVECHMTLVCLPGDTDHYLGKALNLRGFASGIDCGLPQVR